MVKATRYVKTIMKVNCHHKKDYAKEMSPKISVFRGILTALFWRSSMCK